MKYRSFFSCALGICRTNSAIQLYLCQLGQGLTSSGASCSAKGRGGRVTKRRVCGSSSPGSACQTGAGLAAQGRASRTDASLPRRPLGPLGPRGWPSTRGEGGARACQPAWRGLLQHPLNSLEDGGDAVPRLGVGGGELAAVCKARLHRRHPVPVKDRHLKASLSEGPRRRHSCDAGADDGHALHARLAASMAHGRDCQALERRPPTASAHGFEHW